MSHKGASNIVFCVPMIELIRIYDLVIIGTFPTTKQIMKIRLRSHLSDDLVPTGQQSGLDQYKLGKTLVGLHYND